MQALYHITGGEGGEQLLHASVQFSEVESVFCNDAIPVCQGRRRPAETDGGGTSGKYADVQWRIRRS